MKKTAGRLFHSIKFRFFGFVAVLLLVIFLLLSIYPINPSRDAVFEEKKNSLTSRGSAAASALSRLDRMSADSIKEVLQLLDMAGYSRITVTDKKGVVVYDSLGSPGAVTENADILNALGSKKTIFRSDFSNRAFNSSYTTPMSYRGEIVGALYMSELDTEQAEIILNIQSWTRGIAIGICVITLASAIIFGVFLLSRIDSLSESMRIVAGGDYAHRLVTRGSDELTELGNEFNALTERLQTTESQRRRFVSDASHELKTPLASIRLLSDSIVQNENMDSETVREFVSDIGNEAGRLQHTTEKLLDLSRLDDDVRLASEPVDMKQVALDAYASVRHLADERHIKFRCDLDDGCVVMATVDNMFHIIFNLMENAVKYNVDGGRIDVVLNDDGENITLSVKDTGIGIPEEERFNIFSRFYRVDKARSREAGGSGLGLSIVHDAVKAHGGSITVGANKDRGSVFTVKFPKPSDDETGI